MKKFLFLVLMCSAIQLNAQTPEDALRLSWFAPNGTPRSNALGGAMGSLGGRPVCNKYQPGRLRLL